MYITFFLKISNLSRWDKAGQYLTGWDKSYTLGFGEQMILRPFRFAKKADIPMDTHRIAAIFACPFYTLTG